MRLKNLRFTQPINHYSSLNFHFSFGAFLDSFTDSLGEGPVPDDLPAGLRFGFVEVAWNARPDVIGGCGA